MRELRNVTPTPPSRFSSRTVFLAVVVIALVGGGAWWWLERQNARRQAEWLAQANQAAAELAASQRAQRLELFGDLAVQRGVQFKSSGLGYRVLSRGNWAAPKGTDVVRIQYVGRLRDGTIFDQTQTPLQTPLTALIPGMAAGLQLVQPGGRIQLFVPPDLGYGAREVAGIPPRSGLIFEVELLAVNP